MARNLSCRSLAKSHVASSPSCVWCASAPRAKLDGPARPTGHNLIDRDNEPAHRTAVPGAKIGNIGWPRVRLVLIAPELHLHDDTEHLVPPPAAETTPDWHGIQPAEDRSGPTTQCVPRRTRATVEQHRRGDNSVRGTRRRGKSFSGERRFRGNVRRAIRIWTDRASVRRAADPESMFRDEVSHG
jgi:hypothetical protein